MNEQVLINIIWIYQNLGVILGVTFKHTRYESQTEYHLST